MTRNQKIIFAIIILSACFLIFFRLGRQDLLGDDAHYSLRALGYFDYMASQKQTTPLQWFGYRPWWSYLSFHDHPPMYFFIQHIFFKIFGATVIVSRFTSAFAALGSVIVMFFLGKRFGGARIGLIAMAALTLNNYFIWNGRIGHIESLLIFWFLLSFLFLLKALQDSPQYFKWAGLFFGLALLTKFSLLFMLPAILIYLTWQERRVFKLKEFWLGLVLFLLVASPLLIYDLKMFQTRGHFDVQLADLFGQSNRDWYNLQSRAGGFHLEVRSTLRYLYFGMSGPYFALVCLAVLFAVWQGNKNSLWWFVVLELLITLIFLMYVGGAARWLSLLTPFAALLVAGLVDFLWRFRKAVLVSGAVLAAYFLVFIFNSNHAIAASRNQLLTSQLRLENYGYNQLDTWVVKLTKDKKIPYRTRNAQNFLWFLGIKPEALPFLKDKNMAGDYNSLLIYDDAMNWFPTVWTFGRQRVYRGVPSVTSREFLDLIQAKEGLEILNFLEFEQFYFVRVAQDIRSDEPENTPAKILENMYRTKNVQPEVIRDLQGHDAFYIYRSPKIDL